MRAAAKGGRDVLATRAPESSLGGKAFGPALPLPRGPRSRARGEALKGQSRTLPARRLSSGTVPGDAVPYVVLVDSFRGDWSGPSSPGHQKSRRAGLDRISTEEIGHCGREWRTGSSTRRERAVSPWGSWRYGWIVSLAAPHVPVGVLHPENAGVEEASRLKTFPEEAGPSSRPD
ncbi:hypothetical protein Nepgr_001272 [Nepenthes gracilis]|uniref:Uncharacterized protein n=1 Tax=Nepenthes gracilis TaxID=150966 RepID=A0AAD3RXG1_NEPGR|nr:hypothetical protein Nepgr_001272 [Nepenthes gracilis]